MREREWGAFKELPVTAADYWYYERRTDSEGDTTDDYSHFSVVIYSIAAELPHVWFQTENLITRLADHLSFRDIEFESEEFNRAWQVQAADRAFAFKLIDARMMSWLLGNGSGFGFEALGSDVLVYSKRRRVDELRLLFEVGRAFVDQIPRIIGPSTVRRRSGERPGSLCHRCSRPYHHHRSDHLLQPVRVSAKSHCQLLVQRRHRTQEEIRPHPECRRNSEGLRGTRT